jgi:hypothetical protein
MSQPFAIPSAILVLLALPLVLGLVPRNRYFGVRTPAALADDATWYRVNQAAGLAFLLAGAVYGVVALALPYDRAARDNLGTWAIHLAAFVLPTFLGLSVAVRGASPGDGPR